jgi:hypothetical protein
MVKEKLIYQSKLIYPDGAVQKMIIWQLPQKSHSTLHDLKYRLYYGDVKGRSLVRYDNETGKGDHKHINNKEEVYHFSTVEKLVEDFQKDINKFRRKNNEGK